MRLSETRCMAIVSGVVRDAISQSHLELPETTCPENVVFALWSQTYGAHSIIATAGSMDNLGIQDPFFAIHDAVNRCLDGFGWQPLSTEYDYIELFERLQTEVFPMNAAKPPSSDHQSPFFARKMTLRQNLTPRRRWAMVLLSTTVLVAVVTGGQFLGIRTAAERLTIARHNHCLWIVW